jgi:predicted phosphodiesterase
MAQRIAIQRWRSEMKLGLITDIHEDVARLGTALARLKEEQSDQVVVLGDVCDIFHGHGQLAETCRLLSSANAVGVWGNHDYRLCIEKDPLLRADFPVHVIDYLDSLRPRIEIDDCLLSHVEPWLNPEYFPDLWYGGGPPDSPERLARIFDAVSQRVVFAGHCHTWLIATPDGITEWNGTAKTTLRDGRYFVVVGALCDGHFGVFDTDTAELVPLRC